MLKNKLYKYVLFLFIIAGCKDNQNIEVKELKGKYFTKSLNVVVDLDIPKGLKTYYKGLDNMQFKESLKKIVSKRTYLRYADRHKFLYKIDADLKYKDSVVLLYTGELVSCKEYQSPSNSNKQQSFNTEHVFPKSKLVNKTKGIPDLHHLRVCNKTINTKRSNHPFVDGKGKFKDLAGAWFPGDQWKGDIARMVFYLNLIYGDSFDLVGSKELFLKWNIEDPVSAFEIQRNNLIYKAQGNRNPFIDNPYIATIIYGGADAENKW